MDTEVTLRLGCLLSLALALILAPTAYGSAAIDTSFGTNGETVIPLNAGWAPDWSDAVRASNDRIVVAGSEDHYGVAIARVNSNGKLDSTFDGDGITTVAVSTPTTDNIQVEAVAVDSSDNVYASAVIWQDANNTIGAVYKFTSSGALDSGFGTGGSVAFHGPATGLRLNPAGDRLYVTDEINNDLHVHALDPATGQPVTAFGTNGVATIAMAQPFDVYDLVVRPSDGKIIVGGSTQESGATSWTMMVARFGSDGSPDSGFGAGGVVTPFLGTSAHISEAYDLFSVDSSLYAVGFGDDGQSMAIAHVDNAGHLDTAFGGGLLTDYAPGTNGWWDGVNVQQDGSVVVTGGRWDTQHNPSAITRRYTPSGGIDSTFGDGGTVALAGDFPAMALVAQPSVPRYVSLSARTINGKRQAVLTGIKPTLSSPPGDTPVDQPPAPQSQPPAQTQPPSTPTQPAPKPLAPGCTRSVSVGPLQVESECLKREGMTWVSTASAKVGGLKFVPNGADAKLVIDPLNLRIAAKGKASIVFEASLFGRTVGPVKIYQGSFDWTWQYKPDLAFLASFVTPQGGQSISLSTLSRLPGLGSVGSLPRLPDLGFPDFSKLSAADVGRLANKIPSLSTADVNIPLSLLGINSLPELRFALPGGNTLFGFGLTGDVGVKMAERAGVKGAEIAVNMKLPPNLGSVAGTGKFWAGLNGALAVDALGFHAPEIWFPGQIVAKPVDLSFDGPSNTWSGNTAILLGFSTNDTKLGGEWEIVDGRLRRIGITAGGIPLGSSVTLDSFTGALTLDPTRVYGSVALGAGPKVTFLGGKILGVNGTFDFNGDFAQIGGTARVANANLAKANVKYWWNGVLEASGDIRYFIDGDNQYGFSGHVEGSASSRAFNIEGNARFQAGSKYLDGRGIVSSKGVAGCASVQGVLWLNLQLGAGYKWGASSIDWLGGACDFAAYRAKVSAHGAAASDPQTVTVAGGQRAVSFKVEGIDGAPKFTLTGPGGASVATPANGDTVIDDRFVVIQQSANNTTYVAVAKPAAGAWTFTPAAGSGIKSIASAGALPKPKVSAKIAHGKLNYRLTPVPGQTVTFQEEGNQVATTLGNARGRAGSLALQPNAGPSGLRKIAAVVEYNGFVRDRITVATYKARAKALAPPRVIVRRNGRSAVKAAWTAVPSAVGYRARITVNGAITLRTLPARARSITIPSVLPTANVSVEVRALGGPTRVGKPGKASLKKAKIKKRTGKAPKKKTKAKKKKH